MVVVGTGGGGGMVVVGDDGRGGWWWGGWWWWGVVGDGGGDSGGVVVVGMVGGWWGGMVGGMVGGLVAVAGQHLHFSWWLDVGGLRPDFENHCFSCQHSFLCRPSDCPESQGILQKGVHTGVQRSLPWVHG